MEMQITSTHLQHLDHDLQYQAEKSELRSKRSLSHLAVLFCMLTHKDHYETDGGGEDKDVTTIHS